MGLLVESEELPLDAFKLWEEIKTNVPVFMASPVPLPITSNRRTKIVILQNPRTSEVKELDLHFTIGSGILQDISHQTKIKILSESVEEKIERVCEENAPRSVQECKSEMYDWQRQKDSEIVQYCKKEEMVRQNKIQQQQQQYRLAIQQQLQQQQQEQQQQLWQQQEQQHQEIFQKQQQMQQQLHEECLSESHLCMIERKWCIKKLDEERQSRQEAENTCDKKLVFCSMRFNSNQLIKSSLTHVEKGVSVSLSMGAILRGRKKSEDKKIVAHSNMVKPSYMWNIEEILRENLHSKVMISGI